MKHIVKLCVVAGAFICMTGFCLFADELYLKNGDKITGRIAEVSNPVSWKREIAAGFSRTTGNTREDNFAGSFSFNRQRKHRDEWTAKGNLFYSSKKRKMDKQKWFLMGRYAYSFGNNKKWYNFYKIEADHDRFANIDYRLVPAAGIGYWLLDTENTRFMLEAGLGPEITYFRDDTKSKTKWVLIPRAWLEQKIFENTTLVQGVSYYPNLEDFNHYRLRSETALNFKVHDNLALRISVWNDYTSNPPEDTKKNDMQFVTSLAYSF